MSAATAAAWIVCGAPGSGKSLLGRALAAELAAVLLDQDVMTGPLTAVAARLVGAGPHDLDDPRVRRALGSAPYDALLATAADNLRLGRDVVLVAPFSRLRGTADGADSLTALAFVPRRIVWARCPPEELLRRLQRRGAARDRRKLADPDALLATLGTPPTLPHAAVDTTRPMDAQIQAAVQAPTLPRTP